MSNTTIPNLPLATALDGTEQLGIVQASTSKRTTTQAIANLASPTQLASYIPFGTPASASATGSVGQIMGDGNYLYFCVSPSAWKRVAISSW